METVTEKIKRKARELGFVKIGVAKAANLSTESVHLMEWLRRGFHGTMSWMERNPEKRSDPRMVLPDAQSVVAVAMNYYVDAEHERGEDVGKISRYAWGDDYHDIVTDRLDRLGKYMLEVSPGSSYRFYVDTGPVMDKAWAAKAGLGWQGKHTNLITKEYGSWVFLGEIITDVVLQYDEPIADFCGSCTACIDACPTGAITEPYVVDSNKCISYLTIEHRGEIPADLKPKMDNWVYGCDICQDVCPWNRFQQPTEIEGFSPRAKNLAPPLEELVHMNQGTFKDRFRKSPMKRTKHSGIVRNAKAILEGRR